MNYSVVLNDVKQLSLAGAASKYYFCRDNHVFVVTKDVSVATKMILVAAPAMIDNIIIWLLALRWYCLATYTYMYYFVMLV